MPKEVPALFLTGLPPAGVGSKRWEGLLPTVEHI
jgi:hypothetical protein